MVSINFSQNYLYLNVRRSLIKLNWESRIDFNLCIGISLSTRIGGCLFTLLQVESVFVEITSIRYVPAHANKQNWRSSSPKKFLLLIASHKQPSDPCRLHQFMFSASDDYDFWYISLCECLQRNFSQLAGNWFISICAVYNFPLMNDEQQVLIPTETWFSEM